MKERPILFSGEMVCAILDWRKTQTRRVVKASKLCTASGFFSANGWSVFKHPRKGWFAVSVPDANKDEWYGKATSKEGFACPYGVPGDRLWVRETFYEHAFETKISKPVFTGFYRATEPYRNVPWRPSIHMPRWASRINLEITNVRVERLQDISEADAMAEGTQGKHSFAALWDTINVKRASWASNPWVWVIEFAPASDGETKGDEG